MRNKKSMLSILLVCYSIIASAQTWQYVPTGTASFTGPVTAEAFISNGTNAEITINKTGTGAQAPQLKFQSNASDGLIIGSTNYFMQAVFNHSFPSATGLLFQVRGSTGLNLNYDGTNHNAIFSGLLTVNKVGAGAQSPQIKLQSNNAEGLIIGNADYFRQAFFNHSYPDATDISFQLRGNPAFNLRYNGSAHTAILPGTLRVGKFLTEGGSTPFVEGYALNVAGSIRSNEVVVNTTGADFVFQNNYKLLSLHEVEKYIVQNKHLPEIPSAAEMQQNGVALGELDMKLLQKIEELTLYVIELKKEIDNLKSNKD